MAQTKRRRRTKHRGTPAGTVEARGRTSKPVKGKGKQAATKSKNRAARVAAQADRLNRPPTWRGAINRAGIAAAIFFAAIILLFKEPPGQAAGLAGFMFLLYIPMSYITDMALYRRRQRKKGQGGKS